MRLSARRRERLLDAGAVGVPMLVAAFLCLYELRTRSLWLDEAATVAIASQHGAAFGSALAHDGGNMLGYYGLLHVLIGWFGNGSLVLRLPSALAATATAGLTAALAGQLWGRLVAFAAGILTAVSLSLVYWGQDARAYAITVALTSAAFLVWIHLMRARRASAGGWVAYVVLMTAAIYTGFEAVLVIPAQLLVLLWRRDRVRPALLALGTALACCVPLAVLAAQRGSAQLFWVPSPSLRTAKQVLQALTSSGLQPGYYTATGDVLLIATLVALLLAGWQLMSASAGWLPVLLILWAGLPIMLALLLSLAGHSIFQARYVLVSLPALALLLASALTSRMPRVPVAAALIALLALRALQLAPSYGVSTEEWRSATAYVADRSQRGDCLAFYPLDARMPFEYYGGGSGRLPPSILPALSWARVRPFVEQYASLTRPQLASLPRSCPRLWLVWSHQGKLGGPPVSAANFRRLLALRSGVRRDYRRAMARRFGRASPIMVELLTGAR